MEQKNLEKLDRFFKSKVEGQSNQVKAFPSGAKAAKGKIGMAYDKLKEFAKKNGAEIAVYSAALISSAGLTLWGAAVGASPEVVFAGATVGGGLVTAAVDMAVQAKAKRSR